MPYTLVLMYHPRLRGSYYEMGYTYSLILNKVGFKLPLIPENRLDLGLKCKKEVNRFFPEIMEEIQGITDACKLDYDSLTSIILTLEGAENQYSIFAVTDGEKVYIGMNYDMYYKFKDYLESYLTMPDDGYWSIGQTDIYVGAHARYLKNTQKGSMRSAIKETFTCLLLNVGLSIKTAQALFTRYFTYSPKGF